MDKQFWLRFLQVIPDSVAAESVLVVERRGEYTLTWARVNNTNFGALFYQVRLEAYSVNYIILSIIVKNSENYGDIV